MSDVFRLPLEHGRLYGTNYFLSASIVREYLPIISGGLMATRREDLLDYELREVKTIKWDKIVVSGEQYYNTSLVYCDPIEGWISGEPGNPYYYRLDVRKEFDMNIEAEIVTTMGKIKDILLPIKTEIRITGSPDDLLLFRLTY